MLVARHNAGRSDDVAMGIADGQDVGGADTLAALVGDRLAPFPRQRTRAIQIHVSFFHPPTNRHDAALPHTLEAAVPAPLADVVVDCASVDLFWGALSALAMTGSCAHG
jgi:hypothetical protein